MNLKYSLLFLATFVTNSPALPTYEEIRQQVEDEANQQIEIAKATFEKDYTSSCQKLFLSSGLTGLLTVLILRDGTNLSYLYGALAGIFGYITLLQHAELMEKRRVCNKEIHYADQVYHQKLDHLHTRHYQNDIAKFIVKRLEELLTKSSAIQ